MFKSPLPLERAVAGALALGSGASLTLPAQAAEGGALLGTNSLTAPGWGIYVPFANAEGT